MSWAVLHPDGTYTPTDTERGATTLARGLDSVVAPDGEGSCNHLVVPEEVARRIARRH